MNIIKNGLAVITAVVLMVVCVVPAHAEDNYYMMPMDSHSVQSAEIEYNVPSTFIVEIPACMSIDTPIKLSGTNFNIAADKCVVASIEYDSFNDNSNIPMYMDGSDDSIEVAIYNNDNGEKVTRELPIVARFIEDDMGYATTNYFHAELTGSDSAFAKAGQYRGTLTFSISTQMKE